MQKSGVRSPRAPARHPTNLPRDIRFITWWNCARNQSPPANLGRPGCTRCAEIAIRHARDDALRLLCHLSWSRNPCAAKILAVKRMFAAQGLRDFFSYAGGSGRDQHALFHCYLLLALVLERGG